MPRHIYNDPDKLRESKLNYIDISIPLETKNYSFFQFIDHGKYLFSIYNKETAEWQLSETKDGPKTGLVFNNKSEVILRLYNCTPDSYLSIVQAHDFISYFSEDYPNLISNIQESDNPIFFIGQLK